MVYVHHKRRTVLLACQGTRGDIQPLLAVALGLNAAGYSARIAAATDYQSWIEDAGVEWRRLGSDVKAWFLEENNARKLTSSPVSALLHMGELLKKPFQDQVDDLLNASDGADAILFGALSDLACDVAEARQLPAAALLLQPAMPTREFPSVLWPSSDMGPWLNRLTAQAALQTRVLSRRQIGAWRRDVLGLRAKPATWTGFTVDGRPVDRIYGFSKHVLPRPHDWSDKDHVTGYWFNDAELHAEPDHETAQGLSAFLAVKPKPIYISFGSMPLPNPAENLAMLIDVLRRLGLRAIISRGWAGLDLGSLDRDQFYAAGDVPHSWMFDKVSGVVHHGGAGTTATALRAGAPSLVCPLGFDQPFWGRRVAALGCGPEPLPMRSWTPARLAASLTSLTENPSYREKAQAIGKAIQAENGVAVAVERIRSAIGDP